MARWIDGGRSDLAAAVALVGTDLCKSAKGRYRVYQPHQPAAEGTISNCASGDLHDQRTRGAKEN
jgi:hypothetical protein